MFEYKKVLNTKYIHITYLITALALLLLSFFIGSTLDIQIHDLYLVVALSYISIWLGILYLIYGGLAYLLFFLKKPMNKLGFWFHYLVTALGSVLIILFIHLSTLSEPIRYNDYSVYNEGVTVESYNNYSGWIGNIMLAVFLVQLLFLSNLIRSLIKRKQ